MGESRSERIERLFAEIDELGTLVDEIAVGMLAITRDERTWVSRRIQEIITELEAIEAESNPSKGPNYEA